MRRCERSGIDGDPAVRAGEATHRDDLWWWVRRHPNQEVERLLAAVLEHDAARFDALDLRPYTARDRAGSELLDHPVRTCPSGVRHQHRLQGGDGDRGAFAQAAAARVLVEAEGAFVGSGRARVRRTRDEDDDPAAVEVGERSGGGRDAGEGPDVVSVLGEPGPRGRGAKRRRAG
jgi:hypothetical protein